MDFRELFIRARKGEQRDARNLSEMAQKAMSEGIDTAVAGRLLGFCARAGVQTHFPGRPIKVTDPNGRGNMRRCPQLTSRLSRPRIITKVTSDDVPRATRKA